MKMVFQVAAGIVLGALLLWGVRYAIVTYEAKQVVEHMKAYQQQQSQRQQEAQRQLAERRAQQEAMQKEQERQRLAALQEQARKRAAFNKWWQEPGWCQNPTDMKVLVRCADIKSAKRAEFDLLWEEGRDH